MKFAPSAPDELVGKFRTFGEFGPVYQVLRKVDEKTLRVRVLESGEEFNYLFERAANDPEAE